MTLKERHILTALWRVANGDSQRAAARDLPVSQATVSRAVRRETHQDLPRVEDLRGVSYDQAVLLAESDPPRTVYVADVERLLVSELTIEQARRLSAKLWTLPDPTED